MMLASRAVILAVIAVVILADRLAAQTTIVTRDGGQVVGEILADTADVIVIRSADGVVTTIPWSLVASVRHPDADTIGTSDGDRSRWDNGYWMIGALFGTPGAFNVAIGRNVNGTFGIRLTGGYVHVVRGVELDASYRFLRKGSLDHSLVVGIGATDHIEDPEAEVMVLKEWRYVQAGYNLHWGGFDMTAGLSVGVGDLQNPAFVINVGYVHRFF